MLCFVFPVFLFLLSVGWSIGHRRWEITPKYLVSVRLSPYRGRRYAPV